MSRHLDALLDAEREAECARHDEHQRAETRRILAGEPYLWPQVAWRSETPARRRGEPRSSRFADLGA